MKVFFLLGILVGIGYVLAEGRAPVPIEITCRVEARGSLDQTGDTLRQDDNSPVYAFRFPDAYGDNWRNQRFRASEAVTIQGVLFAFPTRNFSQWTTGTPDLIVRLWPMGEDSLPVAGGEWLTDTLAFAQWSSRVFELDSTWQGDSTQFVYADLAGHAIALASGEWFHAGYSAALGAGDSLAILADDGIPETSYASEWWDGRFVRMRDGWRGVNFFIRVIVSADTGLAVLCPDGMAENFSLCSVYPNPFNSRATITFDVARPGAARVGVFDLLGRERLALLDVPNVFGAQRITFDGNSLSSGKYFVRVQTPDGRYAVPVVLVK